MQYASLAYRVGRPDSVCYSVLQPADAREITSSSPTEFAKCLQYFP